MFCPKCGNRIDDVKFCPYCGADTGASPITVIPPLPSEAEQKVNNQGSQLYYGNQVNYEQIPPVQPQTVQQSTVPTYNGSYSNVNPEAAMNYGNAPKAAKKKRKSKVLPVLISILVVFALVFGGYTLLTKNQNEDKGDSVTDKESGKTEEKNTATLEVIVLNSENDEEVAEAKVSVYFTENDEMVADSKTNKKGKAKFDLSYGKYYVSVEAEDFAELTLRDVDVSKESASNTVSIKLTPEKKSVIDSFTEELVEKYGKTSGETFVSCIETSIQQYPDGICGIVSVNQLDTDEDGKNELLVVRVTEEKKLILEVYVESNGQMLLGGTKKLSDISFCQSLLAYVYYSDKHHKYCIAVDTSEMGSYTRVNSFNFGVSTLSGASVEDVANVSYVPFMDIGMYDSIEKEAENQEAPYLKYSTSMDNRVDGAFYMQLCEVVHLSYLESSAHIFNSHKLTVCEKAEADAFLHDNSQDEVVATPTIDSKKRDAEIYNEYLKGSALDEIFVFVDKTQSEYLSCLMDMNGDGVYELVLQVVDKAFAGPKGYQTFSYLYTIENGEVKLLKDTYFGGGTAGGSYIGIKYFKEEKTHYPVCYGTFYDGTNASSYNLEAYSFDGSEINVETSLGDYRINTSSPFYQEEIQKWKAKSSVYYTEEGYIHFSDIEGAYVSKDEYVSFRDGFVDPTDSDYTFKIGNASNPLGLN